MRALSAPSSHRGLPLADVKRTRRAAPSPPAATARDSDPNEQPCAPSTTATTTTNATILQRRRALLAAAATLAATASASAAGRPPPALAAISAEQPPTTTTTTTTEQPTARVALSFGLADRAVKSSADRTLGDRSIIPLDDAASHPLGTITIALYGGRAKDTTANFLAAVRAGLLDGTTVSRIIPGEYVQLGRQGSRRQGEVEAPKGFFGPNADLSSAAALRVGAGDRPGTVALSVGECDEDPSLRSRPGYQPFEFFITTGPGPAPRLNDANVAFGKVEGGFDVLAAISRVPAFSADARQRQLNRFAAFIGDDRADNVARRYGRPLRAVVVLKAEVV